MAHAINERPHVLAFSKNDICYRYTVSDLSRAGLFFSAKLRYKLAGQSVYQELQLMPMVPNADGTVIIYLNQIIDSLLTYQVPSATALVTNASCQVLVYHLHTREITNADADPSWNTHEGTKERTALKGGIEQNRWSRNNFFTYQSTNKKWYTWQPNYRSVFENQPLYLSAYIPYQSGAVYRIMIAWKCSDGTTNQSTRTLTLNAYDSFYHINVNATFLNFQDSSKTVVQYSISLLRDFSTIFNNVVFDIDDTYLYAYHDFIYTNSLGGIDSIRVKGEASWSIEKNFEENERSNTGNWNATVKGAFNTQQGISAQRRYKGDVGFMKSSLDQMVLAELVIAPLVYEYVDARWLPILQLQKTYGFGSESATKWSLPIEWQYAESNEVFTPSNVTLGIGSDTETYP